MVSNTMGVRQLMVAVALTLSANVVLAQDGHANPLGMPGMAIKITRSVMIDIQDTMRFTPSSVAVKRDRSGPFMRQHWRREKLALIHLYRTGYGARTCVPSSGPMRRSSARAKLALCAQAQSVLAVRPATPVPTQSVCRPDSCAAPDRQVPGALAPSVWATN